MLATQQDQIAAFLAERAKDARKRLDAWETIHACPETDPAYPEWCVWRTIFEVEADAAARIAEEATQ